MRERFILFILALLWGSVASVHAQDGASVATRTVEEQRTIDAYKRASQAVVFITTRTYVMDPFDLFDEVKPREGTGTGTIVDAERGLVLTNLHVIEGALQGGGSVEITLASGASVKARLRGYDQESDLAVFQLVDPPRALVGLPYGDSSKLEVGQRVLAIGNPFGLKKILTTGIISALGQSMKTPQGAALRELIQTDAAINPGNSGGPLLDADGRLIGINTAILSQSGDSAGIGFAVPINTIKSILPELSTTGKVRRPRLGWQIVDTDQGPMVLRVQRDGPADKAGVQPIERLVASGGYVRGVQRDIEGADLIYSFNGSRVRNRDDVEELLRQVKNSDSVRLVVRRGGLYGKEREVVIAPRWE